MLSNRVLRSAAFWILLAISIPLTFTIAEEYDDTTKAVLEIHMSDSGLRLVTEDSLTEGLADDTEFDSEPDRDPHYYEDNDGRFYFDEDVVIAADELVRDAVVVLFGDLDLYGDVRGDVVVLMGDLTLHDRAKVSGDVVCLGGQVEADSTASFEGEVVCFPISALLTGKGWRVLTGDKHVSVDWDSTPSVKIDRGMTAFKATLRLVGMLFLTLILLLIFRKRLESTSSALRYRPGRSLLFGLLFALGLLILIIPIIVTLLLIVAFLAVILSPIPPLMIIVVIAFLLTIVIVVLGIVFVPSLMPLFAFSRYTTEKSGLSPFLSVPIWVLIIWLLNSGAEWIGGPLKMLLILIEVLFYLIGAGAILTTRFGKVAFGRGGQQLGLIEPPPTVAPAPEAVEIPSDEA